MYEIALSVAACLRAGTRADVAWVVASRGLATRNKAEAVALTPGGGRIGSLVGGAVHDQLAERAAAGQSGRLIDAHISDLEATLAGLDSGGDVRCVLVNAADLPADLWDRLRERDPVALVTRLDGDTIVGTALYGPDTIAEAGAEVARLFDGGVSDTMIDGDTVVTVLWPVPRLLIVGAGAVTDALCRTAELLGWQPQVVRDASSATGVIAGLAALDKVVVTGHDVEVTGPALRAALDSPVGYIGALGGRRMREARADWLAYRGVTDLTRIHGPAGLDIGANTPAEIAISIVAEAVAAGSGTTASVLDVGFRRG